MSTRASDPSPRSHDAAARAVWRPSGPVPLRAPTPAWRRAARGALVGACAALVLALLGRLVAAGVVALVASTSLLLAAAAPLWFARLERTLLRASAVVGRVLAYAVLAPVFFLVMTPLRFILGRGALAASSRRRRDRRESTWRPRPREDARLDRPY